MSRPIVGTALQLEITHIGEDAEGIVDRGQVGGEVTIVSTE